MDDWAYTSFVTQPEVPRQSIVKSVALSHDLPAVDYNALKVRRNSFPKTASPAALEREWPLGRKEQFELWDPSKWAVKSPFAVLPPDSFEADLGALHLAQLATQAKSLREGLDTTAPEIDSILASLNELDLKSKDTKTRQLRLQTLHTQISETLAIYDILDYATRALNRPGTRIVTSNTFPKLLKDLDNGLAFCKSHPDFKDMDLYEIRFQQCVSRAHAMTLEHCTFVWRTAQTKIMAKMSEANAVTRDALLWPKFAAESARLGELISSLDTESQIYAELRRAYSSVRTQLLAAFVKELLMPTFPQTLAKLKDLIEREKGLWLQIFQEDSAAGSKKPAGFSEFTVLLSEPLYIDIRGTIVHEMDLGKLCEIIMLLQEEEEFAICVQIFRDAQNRLLFRADQIIDNALSIRKFSVKELRSHNFAFVSTTLEVLTQIYQVMNSAVFDNFAYQSIKQCISALAQINSIAILGPIEGPVFHIHQLVVLQHGMFEFDLGQIVTSHIDFSGIVSFLENIRTTPKNLLDLNKFMGSLPRVVDQMYDSIQEVYSEMQAVVQTFTENCVASLMEPASKKGSSSDQIRALKERVPKKLDQIVKMTQIHIKDPKVIDALLDSMLDKFLKSYEDFYGHIAASPDEMQALTDPEAFGVWLSTQRSSINLC